MTSTEIRAAAENAVNWQQEIAAQLAELNEAIRRQEGSHTSGETNKAATPGSSSQGSANAGTQESSAQPSSTQSSAQPATQPQA